MILPHPRRRLAGAGGSAQTPPFGVRDAPEAQVRVGSEEQA